MKLGKKNKNKLRTILGC